MTEEKTVLSTAEETVGTQLLRALLAEIQQLQSPWQNTPEEQQKLIIERLRMQVEEAVQGAVRQIARAGFGNIVAQVESLTIKDGAKAVIALARGSEELHELADRVGTRVVIVFADAREYTDGMHVVQAQADQPDLPLEGEQEGEAEAPATQVAA